MQKSRTGVDNLYYALVTQDDENAFVAGTPARLAPVATVTTEPESDIKPQFFDNVAKELLQARGAIKMALEIQGLLLSLKATLLGKTYDATQGIMFDGSGVAPYVAIGFRGENSDGTHHYWWFYKGVFSEPKEELSTKTASAEAKTTKLDFMAISSTYQFAQTGLLNDASRYAEADDADTAFTGAASWFSAVKLAVGGAVPAFTATPSPTDGATGQVTTVAITLTFSNALGSNAELGITLTRVDTGAIISVTRSLNATRKILTLTHAALVATKQYYITLAGVKDVFGQTLADVVYDFTIA